MLQQISQIHLIIKLCYLKTQKIIKHQEKQIHPVFRQLCLYNSEKLVPYAQISLGYTVITQLLKVSQNHAKWSEHGMVAESKNRPLAF